MPVFIKWASLSVGTTTPREMVEIINVIKKALSMNPAQTNKYDRPNETKNIPINTMEETAKEFGSSFPLGSFTLFFAEEKAVKSISRPLKNIRNINPRVERVSSHISSCTISKPLLPIIKPIRISATTTGMKLIFSRCSKMGVIKAANITMTSEATDAPCSIK